MEQRVFDLFTAALAARPTRRAALGLLGSALAVALAGSPLEAKPRKRRKGKANIKRRKDKHRRKIRNRNKNTSTSTNSSGGGAGPIFNVCAEAGTRACSRLDVKTSASINQCNLPNAALVGVVAHAFAGDQINFTNAHLLQANFSAANLSRVCFAGASLRNAVLTATNLDFADLTGADLCGANFTASTVTPAQVLAGDVCCGTLLADGSSAAPCRDGWECCGEGCVNPQTDPYNCGACGNTCAVGELCCNGGCIDPQVDGFCGLASDQCLSPGSDLQSAIHNTDDGGVLILCAGTWQITSTLLLDNDIQIVGGWGGGISEIDAGGNCQVFGIRSGVHVSMSNVSVRGGKAESGAGIFNQGHLTLGDCVISANYARQYGGGIYNENSLRVARGAIENNTAYSSSAVFAGLGIYNDAGTVLIEDALVSSNHQQQMTSPGSGGGVFNYFGQLAIMPNSIVSGNVVTGEGGGVFNEGGIVEVVSASTITINQPDNCAGSPAVPNCVG
ncbi:MAG: pentapeptide repeat-containing protein [Thermomicrobiales bacterium]